jgi:hypothetical protein
MNIPVLPWFFLEYHGPDMMHAALAGTVATLQWLHLIVAALLSIAWAVVATILFRYRGWQ